MDKYLRGDKGQSRQLGQSQLSEVCSDDQGDCEKFDQHDLFIQALINSLKVA